MIYDIKEKLVIRSMEDQDVQAITEAEIEQGWNASVIKYQKRLADQRAGKAVCLVAEYDGQPVGYINVYPTGSEGPLAGKNYPEIVDFGVLEKKSRAGDRHGVNGRGRKDRGNLRRYSVPWSRPAQRIWGRPAHVHKARLYPGRLRRLVSW